MSQQELLEAHSNTSYELHGEFHLVMGEAASPAMQAARKRDEVNICRPASLYVHHLSAEPPSVWRATLGKNNCRKLSMDVTPPVMPTSYPASGPELSRISRIPVSGLQDMLALFCKKGRHLQRSYHERTKEQASTAGTNGAPHHRPAQEGFLIHVRRQMMVDCAVRPVMSICVPKEAL